MFIFGFVTILYVIFFSTKYLLGGPTIEEDISLGGWALITGATEGIGLEFARQLSAKGHPVILVSRRLDKLQQVASQLDTPAITIACDLSQGISEELKESIQEHQPTILINNAGLSYSHAEYLEQVEVSQLESMIQLNCISLMELSRLCLIPMKENNYGSIINIGSGNGRLQGGAPLYSVYAASKAFVEVFSKSLQAEAYQWGVNVHCVVPYYVSTKMSRMKPSLSVPTAKAYVSSILKSSSTGVIIPNWFHYLMDLVLSRIDLSTVILEFNRGIRSRALQKKIQKQTAEEATGETKDDGETKDEEDTGDTKDEDDYVIE